MYKNYKIRPGLLYFTNYHIHDYEGFNKMFNGWKQALREGIYRLKERRTWTRSTNETSLTKDTVKRQDSIMEDYSKTSIFERICQHCTTREQPTFTLNHHHTTTPDKQQTTREYAKNNASEFFLNQRTRINAQRLQQGKISVSRTNQTQDPPTPCSK